MCRLLYKSETCSRSDIEREYYYNGLILPFYPVLCWNENNKYNINIIINKLYYHKYNNINIIQYFLYNIEQELIILHTGKN